jgi:uncharacterized membrane protein
MSFADHAILWLHVTAAVFTIGPGTAAIMSTPRFVRQRNTAVVRYLFRTTRIYSFAALLTLAFGMVLAGMTHKFGQWWISVSLTLFVVAFVLLMLVLRDQRKALTELEAAEKAEGRIDGQADGTAAATIGRDLHVAAVQRGRIASIGGMTALIWLVILVLMAWH